MFKLAKENVQFKTVVFDIIRVFIGEYHWDDLDKEEYKEIIITIENNLVRITLDTHSKEEIMEDISDNNIKRLTKKLLYLLIQENYFNVSDSWGILTGIRPTKIVHRMIDQGLIDKEIYSLLTNDYLLSEDKASLLIEITKKQREFFLPKEEMYKKISIYISIPFCPSICSYCTFGSYLLGKNNKLLDRYLLNLHKELEDVLKMAKEKGITVDKIYVGGGTPSILNYQQLDDLFKKIGQYINFDNLQEFSFEAGRPDTVDREKLGLLKKYGVNRISINPQIMKDHILRRLGRTHTVHDILEIYGIAKDINFKIINMDLIIGIEDNEQDFIESFDHVLTLHPENITIHSLAYKRKSSIKMDVDKLKVFGRKEVFNVAVNKLRKNGYEPYYLYKQKLTVGGQENIGFAKRGTFSIYNIQMIEERQIILGFGVGASSKLINREDYTLENVFNPKDLYYYNDKLQEVINKKLEFIDKISKE